jgi:hypothetical protein
VTNGELAPVTDRRHATFYLTDSLHQLLERTFHELQGDLKSRYDSPIEIEKNRHFRPLMLYLGAQQLKRMETEEVVETLDSVELLDTASTNE